MYSKILKAGIGAAVLATMTPSVVSAQSTNDTTTTYTTTQQDQDDDRFP